MKSLPLRGHLGGLIGCHVAYPIGGQRIMDGDVI